MTTLLPVFSSPVSEATLVASLPEGTTTRRCFNGTGYNVVASVEAKFPQLYRLGDEVFQAPRVLASSVYVAKKHGNSVRYK